MRHREQADISALLQWIDWTGCMEERLWELNVLLFASSEEEVQDVVDRVIAILCPLPSGHEGLCDRRWMVIQSELGAEDAQRWEGLVTRDGHY